MIATSEKYATVTFFGKTFKVKELSKIEVHYNRYFNFVKNLQRYEDVSSPLVDVEIVGVNVYVYHDPWWDTLIPEYDN